MTKVNRKRRASDLLTEESSRHADNLVRFGKLESSVNTLAEQVAGIDKKIQESLINPAFTEQMSTLAKTVNQHLLEDKEFHESVKLVIASWTEVMKTVNDKLIPSYNNENRRDVALDYFTEKLKTLGWLVSVLVTIGGGLWAFVYYVLIPIFTRRSV